MPSKIEIHHPPRVFVSYSWESEEHKQLVRSLATQLRGDGINARLDVWHREGRTIPSFMSSEVRNADFILAVCTPTFQEKIHAVEDGDRMTGSGWEVQIATSIQFEDDRNKFVPILMSGTWSEAAPSLMKGIPYIDFTELSKSAYDELLAKLLGREAKAPPIGIPPESSEDAVAPLFSTEPQERLLLAADLPSNSFVLAASGADESAVEALEGGVFTRCLLKGLAGEADKNGNGTITARELEKYLSEEAEVKSGPTPICFIQSGVDYPILGKEALESYSEVTGVFVGIDQYGGKIPNLDQCKGDASKLFEFFHTSGLDASRLSLLLDKEASRDDIALQFMKTAINARADSLLVFYFAGHATIMASGDYGLVACDSTEDDQTWLNIDVLKASLKVSSAKLGILLLDA